MACTTQPANENHASKFVNADEEIVLMLYDKENHASKFVNADEEIEKTEETELMLYDKEKQHSTASLDMPKNMAATTPPEISLTQENEICKYMPLHKAALRGDWECAKRIFDADEGALTVRITLSLSTALHVAVGTGKALHFVKKLVDLMPVEALALPDIYGDTALHLAARVGNTKAAVILVEKHPALLYVPNNTNDFPIHWASKYDHKETLEYLLKALTRDHPVSLPFSDQSGLNLLVTVIRSGLYDVALNLIRRYPKIATTKLDDGFCALEVITEKKSVFASGSCLNSWQRFIYSYVPAKVENYIEDHNRGDIENSVDNYQVMAKKNSWSRFLGGSSSISVFQKLQSMLWKFFELLVPQIKNIRKQKVKHHQALQVVKCLCEKIVSLNDLDAYRSLTREAIFFATEFGVHEVIEEIVDSIPVLLWTKDPKNCNLFQRAVIFRCENVFNLLYQMSEHQQSLISQLMDDSRNNMLHLAGRLAPPNKLQLIPGAALQMQRELQWFKEVEKFVTPVCKVWLNNDDENPAMVFTREHKELVVQGEKWMKDTANSCTIAAALIATVVFTAAITVPGGNNSTSGLPIFSIEKAFIIFAISDAISLFTSTTSLLMFLSILTSRYSEEDFLYGLPKRLIIGLVMMFLSITAMMVAFSSTLYLVFGQKKAWILIPVAALACLPVTSFMFLQFPLLLDLIFSTYGAGIFGKKSDRPFY